jgi:hypothetical protein
MGLLVVPGGTQQGAERGGIGGRRQRIAKVLEACDEGVSLTSER